MVTLGTWACFRKGLSWQQIWPLCPPKSIICIVFNGYRTKNYDYLTSVCSSYGGILLWCFCRRIVACKNSSSRFKTGLSSISQVFLPTAIYEEIFWHRKLSIHRPIYLLYNLQKESRRFVEKWSIRPIAVGDTFANVFANRSRTVRRTQPLLCKWQQFCQLRSLR